jgi:hypothetical protein
MPFPFLPDLARRWLFLPSFEVELEMSGDLNALQQYRYDLFYRDIGSFHPRY